MWPLSLKAGERGDALQGTLSTPLTQHIAKLRQNSACAIKIWIILFNNKKPHKTTCPFVFAATAAPSAGCSTAASSFPAVLEICAPMLLFQQRDPTDEMNEQRPQASSPEKSSQTPTPPSATETEESAQNHDDHKGTCERLHKEKVAKVRKTRILSIFFHERSSLMEKLAPPQMRCGIQRPSPLMNGQWGYDDKAIRSPPIKSPKSQRVGRSWSGWEGGARTIGETQQHGLQLVFSFLFFSQKLDVLCFGLYWA